MNDFYNDKRARDGRTTRCKCCLTEINKSDYIKLKDWHSNYRKQWNAKNPDKLKSYREKHNKINYEKNRDYFQQYVKINQDKRKASTRRWREEKPWMNAAKEAKRRATKLKATPKWADLKAIKEFYKNCPKGYHVDHIIPLKGRNVCGLHVLENLQYLPAIENIKKSNRYDIL